MSRTPASTIEAADPALIANRDLGAIRRFHGMYRRAFPDLQVEVEILVKAKDRAEDWVISDLAERLLLARRRNPF